MSSIVEFGNGDLKKIQPFLKAMDDLQSRMQKVNARKRFRMRKAWFRLIQKVKDMMQDCHNKIIAFLLKHYDTILVSDYKPSQMLSTLRSKTSRAMNTWAFGYFKQRLLWKAKTLGKNVHIVNEAYTSQTCIQCGDLTKTSKEIRTCPHCNFKMDRDHMAAINIFIRTFTCRLRPGVNMDSCNRTRRVDTTIRDLHTNNSFSTF